MKNLENSKAYKVFKYFEEISNIPRGSKNEKEISDFLEDFGRKLKLEVIQDEALNIIIKKPATKGYENAPTVILQGHMDMVCEKNKGTEHDFTKDPIKLVVKGDDIYATGTTLGADNGIAVAYAMAILADDTVEHPALEVLLTSDEETGMTGAMNISKEHINGKILLNLDSEEEGYFLVSCAGGIRTTSYVDIERETLKEEKLFDIVVKGLKGGHSGSEIDKGRGNANKILGRALKQVSDEIDLKLVSITGGAKDNAIPREAEAIVAINVNDKVKMEEKLAKLNETLKVELASTDADVVIIVKESESDAKEMFTKECSKKTINLLYVYPNGINTMSGNIKDLVESSSNVGVVCMNNNAVEYHSAVRSSVTSLKEDLVEKIKTITEGLGGRFSSGEPYPAWEFNPESKIRELCKEVYKDMYNEDAIVYALHAGVECGLFEEKLGKLDMISFGPNIRDAHTPEEHVSISSTERVYEYLLELLKRINNNY